MYFGFINDKKYISVAVLSSALYAILSCVLGVNIFFAVCEVILLFSALFFRFKIGDKTPWWVDHLIILAHAAALFLIVQFICGADISSMNFVKFIFNIMLIYGLIAVISFATCSIKAGILSVTAVSVVLAVIDHLVVQTRSYEIQFSDILSISTAMSVAGGYTFKLSTRCLSGLFAAFPFLLIVIINKYPALNETKNRIAGIVTGVSFAALSVVFTVVPSLNTAIGYKTKHWQYQNSENNGFYLCLVKSIATNTIHIPDGYTYESLETSLKNVLGEDAARDIDPDNVSELPNVIVVMNETFSDLDYVSRSLGYGIEMNQNPLEYFNSFSDDQKNVIKGYFYSSIYGGNTANSEFEFLTGNTMAFIDHMVVPYNLMLDENNSYSIVDIFDSYGYETVGMHPEDKSNWSRNRVYQYLGFDEQYFLRYDNTFVDQIKLTENDMYRGHVSDKTVYEKIIKICENKSDDVPLFVFAVTMQNHGGFYSDNFDYEVTAGDGSDAQLNEYLTTINESDKMLKTLIDYVDGLNEDTIVVFFGDHQPNLNDNVYTTYMGIDNNSTSKETAAKYIVPYMIYANYDLTPFDGGDGHMTSLNYLGSRLLDIVGLEKTAYLNHTGS